MVMWSRVRNIRGLIVALGLIAGAYAFTVLPSEPTALAAGVPAGMTQGFSEIVKKVTPAVVKSTSRDQAVRSISGRAEARSTSLTRA